MRDPAYLFVLESGSLVQTMDGVEALTRVACWGVTMNSEGEPNEERFHLTTPSGDMWISPDDVRYAVRLTGDTFTPIDPDDLL